MQDVTNPHCLEADYDAPTQPLDYAPPVKDEAPIHRFLGEKKNPVRVHTPCWVKAFWGFILIGCGWLTSVILMWFLS